ncbi:MAG: DNA-binding transcriptional activator [Bacteroidales bacterium]
MALYPEKPIGFIWRIKDEASEKVYNLFYDGQGENILFKINEEGKCSLITAEIARNELRDKYWFKVNILFDQKNDSILLTINNQSWSCSKIALPEKCAPKIVFGKSDYIIDVPSFAIRNLSVGNTAQYLFPLCENKDKHVHDSNGIVFGEVINPQWLINDSYHWKFRGSDTSQSVAGVNYNPQKKEVYYFNRDTLHIYNMRSGEADVRVFQEPCPVNLTVGSNFIDPRKNNLYVYELYSQDNISDQASVASLDLNTYQWSAEGNSRLSTQLYHHAAFMDTRNQRYTIFGGFGYMRFSNEFHTYNLKTNLWESFYKFSGDDLYPRYFTSLGFSSKANTVYIFGGMGNQSGEQMVGRTYFYDLHKVDLNNHEITKLWQIKWGKVNMVPIKDMIMIDDSHFYTLCYPESVSESFLQLYRFSLKDGTYEILGDSIPIYSDKINTNARLFYDEQENSLFATVHEFGSDDIRSRLKIYSLATPPVSAAFLENCIPSKRDYKIYIIGGCSILLLITTGCFLLWSKRRKRKETDPDFKSDFEENEVPSRPNSICLFGDFAVRDKSNRDITYMFTARRKQTFCLSLQYSGEEGISSRRLSDLLWPDRPEDKVKNSRGVTINHLRKILGELDGVELIYQKGYFKIEQNENFYCDYSRFIEIISSNHSESNKEELAQILNRGKFLKSWDDPVLDEFKNAVEQQIETVLQQEMRASFESGDYLLVTKFAEAMFNTDPLNEEALSFLIKSLIRLKEHKEAQSRLHVFAMEYKKNLGTDYPYKFSDF